ncbi:hypothetical protein [Promicromonospora sp. AC04]|uniref:hypothetical protein n=1 Tax=Promicromonospora sp. AC04 TaxID=2135723 RepID=UPI001304BB4E|nr:hypothetical protein [Promicromonospora sp. AC04]
MPAAATPVGAVADLDLRVDEVLTKILDRLGPGRIEQATVTGSLLLFPCRLELGEQIARELGLDLPLDHPRSIPGYTIWSGQYLGVDVQVRASLRAPVGSGS